MNRRAAETGSLDTESPGPREGKRMRLRAHYKPCSHHWGHDDHRVPESRWHALSVCLILVVGALAFVSVCWHEFVWEDYHYIANNVSLRELGNIPSFFGREYWRTKHPLQGALYRPLPMVSYAIDYALWGADAKGYHVTNLMCHLLASALVYVACLGLSPSRRAALIAGLIFALHPVHTEPAAWVKCREELLAAVGVLVSFVAFQRSLAAKGKWHHWGHDDHRVPESKRKCSVGWWLLSLLAAIAAYLCKQNAVVLPAVLSGYVWYARSAIGREHQRAAVVVYVAAQILCGGRRPAFWICWAAIFFLPVSNVVFLSGRPIAEQRLYLPSLAFCAVVGLGLEAGVRRARRKSISPAAALALPLAWLVASAPLAIHRNLAWRDNYSLWTATMRCSPASAGAVQEMALAYAEQEQWPRALRLLLRARRLNPQSRDLPHNIAGVLIQQGRAEEAARYLREATELAPRLALARKLEAQGKAHAAREAYRSVLRIDPTNVQAKAGLRRLGSR